MRRKREGDRVNGVIVRVRNDGEGAVIVTGASEGDSGCKCKQPFDDISKSFPSNAAF